MKTGKKKVVIGLAALLITAGTAGTISAQKQTAADASKTDHAYTVIRQDLSHSETLSGKIEAEESATVRFQTSGRLARVNVKVGDTIRKNQLLAALDTRDVKNNLQKKLNSYLSERWDFEQTRDTYKVNGRKMQDLILTDTEKRILEKAQFDLNNSVLDVELTNLSLEYSSLVAPISGIVTGVDVPQAGVNITPASAEFDIVNPESVYFSVLADQNEVTQIENGMPVSVTLDPYPDATYSGTVTSISFTPKAGETSTVYEVKVSIPLDNHSLRYRIDMTGDATFVMDGRRNVLSIPSSFIRTDAGGSSVTVSVNGKKIRRPVQTGEEFDDKTEITDGLTAGDIVYD